MSDGAVVIKTRKFKRNPLLSRRQVRWAMRGCCDRAAARGEMAVSGSPTGSLPDMAWLRGPGTMGNWATHCGKGRADRSPSGAHAHIYWSDGRSLKLGL